MPEILLVEDNDLQRTNLKSMLQEMGEGYSILEASDASHALESLKYHTIDLFYIDIQLQSEDGLKLARYIRKIPGYELTWVVFITSHVEYMTEAFKEIHCYDYVLKPYDKITVQNLTRRLLKDKSIYDNEVGKRKYIFIDVSGIIARIPVNDIIFIEVFGKLCVIHTITGEYKIKNSSLAKLLGMLPENTIIQSHRAYAVNVNYIRHINKNHLSWEISFNNYEKTALVGGRYKETIMEACEEYAASRG